MDAQLTDSQQKIKEQFIEERGRWKWSQMWETILLMDEKIVKAYSSMSSVPHKNGKIPAKIKELICISIDASITHLQEPGLCNHIKHAIELGASKEEILETLEICSAIGNHTILTAVPLLVEQLKKRGINIREETLSEDQLVQKNCYIKKHDSYWPQAYEDLLKIDGDYFEALMEYMDVPCENGPLLPQYKELIWIAIEASPTTVYREGLEYHISKALDLGVSIEEIMEVIEIVSGLGIHSITVGMSILSNEFKGKEDKNDGNF